MTHDPTGTLALRAKFRGDMDRRWAKMRRLTLDALGHSDVLGLSANPLSIMQSAQLRASMGLVSGKRLADAYDPDEPRDEHGMWTSGAALESLANTLQEKHGLSRLNLFNKRGDLHLSDIEVPKSSRGSGVGSAAMRDIVKYADEHGMRVILTPGQRDDRHGTTSRSRLVQFYKQFGFVENKGRNTDFTISEGMYRKPRTSAKDAAPRSGPDMHHAPVAGQDKVKAFQGWMDAGLHQVVFGYSGTWLHPYIGAAVEIAKKRAAGLADEKAVNDAGPEDEPRDKEGKWTAEGNETLSYLLGPKSSVGEIGKETGKIRPEGVSVLSLDNAPVGYSGHRLVYTKGGKIVGAMQLMKSPSNDRHIIANVFVHPEHRRQGIASKLDTVARERFGQLDLSKYESDAGRAFIKTIKDTRLGDAAPRANRFDTMCSLAITELQGICEAVSQQACRELAAGLLQGKTPKRIAARVANRVARVGKVRGRMLANTIVVSTHAGATLDEFRARGITHVGTIAERGPGARKRAMDGIVVLADRRTQPDIEDLDLVEVLTAGDDDVCQDCQDASDDGPWSLDEAEGMLPLHPNCRCAYIPSDDARFADVRELSDYNPNHEPAGSPEGGRFASAGSEGGGSAESSGHDRTGTLADGSFHISDTHKTEIKAMLDSGESLESIGQHPAIQAARVAADAIPETDKQPGYGTAAWRANREFTDGIKGYQSASDHLYERALSYSKGPPRQDHEATIILGPPAAGKSMFAEQIAASNHAAIVDPDDAKKIFTEFKGGIGANAVHEESSVLSANVLQRVQATGTNMILPKVGGSMGSIKKLTDSLKSVGYRVNMVNMAVKEEEAFRRGTRRFLNSGRLISYDYTREVDGNPTRTYNSLKTSGQYEQTVNIDANGKQGHHVITEGGDTSIGRAVASSRRT